MKWISLSLLAALGIFVSACEKHSAAETEEALRAEEGKPPEAADATPAPSAEAPAESKPAADKPATAESKPAKFFDAK
ncbi:MAG TPA: hypothetical protein VGH90_01715 [Chthoniobacteraceae bacterium]|jgi:hypothetical protein